MVFCDARNEVFMSDIPRGSQSAFYNAEKELIMRQAKHVLHNHYSVTAHISLGLKGFVGLCCGSLEDCGIYDPLHCLLELRSLFAEHRLQHTYSLSSCFLLGLTIS